jgi:hypothetical protein
MVRLLVIGCALMALVALVAFATMQYVVWQNAN